MRPKRSTFHENCRMQRKTFPLQLDVRRRGNLRRRRGGVPQPQELKP